MYSYIHFPHDLYKRAAYLWFQKEVKYPTAQKYINLREENMFNPV